MSEREQRAADWRTVEEALKLSKHHLEMHDCEYHWRTPEELFEGIQKSLAAIERLKADSLSPAPGSQAPGWRVVPKSNAATPVQECKICNHSHVGVCTEDAPNAQFRCACPGVCEHGKHPHYCRECNPKPTVQCGYRKALASLANEAAGFVAMADREAHGHTNISVLAARIQSARAALSAPCGCEQLRFSVASLSDAVLSAEQECTLLKSQIKTLEIVIASQARLIESRKGIEAWALSQPDLPAGGTVLEGIKGLVERLRAENAEVRTRIENYADMAMLRWKQNGGDELSYPGGPLAAYDRLVCALKDLSQQNALEILRIGNDLSAVREQLTAAQEDTARIDAYERMSREGIRPGTLYDSEEGFKGWEWANDPLYPTWREAVDAARSKKGGPDAE